MVATMRLNPGVVRSTQPRRMHVAMCAWRVVPRCIEWPQVSREHMEHGLTGASTPASQPGAPPPSSPHNPTSGQPGKPLTAPAAVWLERRSYALSKPDGGEHAFASCGPVTTVPTDILMLLCMRSAHVP